MLFEDTYKSISSPAEGQFRDRGSKFIGLAFPVESEEEVKSILQQIKKDHPQANHHCYAFRLTPDPNVYRCSDDREPSGSAGRPILNAILSAGLTNVMVVVVRYFGGTLLGVPGLINAYREAAADSLRNARIIERTITERFVITCPYTLLNEVYQLLRTSGAVITGQETQENCYIYFEIRKKNVRDFEVQFKKNHLLNGTSSLEPIA
jgi:uncharacterized YigZ family protein